MITLISCISSDTILSEAFRWLCKRRLGHSHNSDIWDLRQNWEIEKPFLQKTLLAGDYQFGPMNRLQLPEGNLDYWAARDA